MQAERTWKPIMHHLDYIQSVGFSHLDQPSQQEGWGANVGSGEMGKGQTDQIRVTRYVRH